MDILPSIELVFLIKNCLCVKTYSNDIPLIYSILWLIWNKSINAVLFVRASDVWCIAIALNKIFFVNATLCSLDVKNLIKLKGLP